MSKSPIDILAHLQISAYKRNPKGGFHWQVRDASGRLIEESQGAFYGDCGEQDAVDAARRLYLRAAHLGVF